MKAIYDAQRGVYLCCICGGVLTSKRSIERGYGQRCGWAKFGRRKRSTNVSQGVPIADLPFITVGNKEYAQTRIDGWD